MRVNFGRAAAFQIVRVHMFASLDVLSCVPDRLPVLAYDSSFRDIAQRKFAPQPDSISQPNAIMLTSDTVDRDHLSGRRARACAAPGQLRSSLRPPPYGMQTSRDPGKASVTRRAAGPMSPAIDSARRWLRTPAAPRAKPRKVGSVMVTMLGQSACG